MSRRTVGWLLALLLAFALLEFLGGRWLTADAVVEWVRDRGAWGVLLLYALWLVQAVAAPLPAFALTVAGGMVYGFAAGVALAWTGAMLGALTCFALARRLGREWVEARWGGPALARANLYLEARGGRAVLLLRLIPLVSFDLVSYGAGLTRMGWRRFMLGTGLGMLPATLVYVWIGTHALAADWSDPRWSVAVAVVALAVGGLLFYLQRDYQRVTATGDVDVGAALRERVARELAACDAYRADHDPGCARCVLACPAEKESYLARHIQVLNDATAGALPANDEIHAFALSCMQTARCVAPCPVGLRRDEMMLALKSRLPALPHNYHRYNLIRGTRLSLKGWFGQRLYNLAQRRKLGRLKRWNQKRPREHRPTLFYFGCYLNSPGVCHDTLAIADRLGEDYTVLGGVSTCCGWPQYLQGRFDLASAYLANLARDLAAVAPQRVITGCMECHAALAQVKQSYGLDFEALTTAAWLAANLDRLQLVPLPDRVILHDSCHRCLKAGDCETAPEVLARAVEGGRVARFKPAGAKSLCCAKYNFEQTPAHNARLRQSKFRQATRAGAQVMVAECLTCAETFAPHAPEGLAVVDLVSYVARALAAGASDGE